MRIAYRCKENAKEITGRIVKKHVCMTKIVVHEQRSH